MDFHKLRAVVQHRGLFHLRRRARHVDPGADAELAGGQRHTLGVVAGRGGDHAALRLARREHRHPVARAAPLVGFHGGEILAFHPDFRAGSRQLQPLQRRRPAETIDPLPREQDFLAQAAVGRKILAFHGGDSCTAAARPARRWSVGVPPTECGRHAVARLAGGSDQNNHAPDAWFFHPPG
jgi:hypothetical protein